MKLSNLFIATVLSFSTLASVAQTSSQSLSVNDENQYVFNPHWYMQVQAGASHTLGEASFGDLISPAMGVYAGYQFTKLWGLRAGLTGWEAKGAWATPKQIYKYNYLQGNIDATLDLGNLFCRYNPKRFFNPYLFLGIGINGAFNNDEAVAINSSGHRLQYLWTDNKVNVVGRGGLGASLRLSDKVFFNIEANANVLSDHYNSKKAGNPDWQFNALAGFTFKFGKSHKKTEPVVYHNPEPVRPAPAPAAKQEPEYEPKQEPVVKAEALHENIFFTIGSAKIRQSEESKIQNLAEYMKKYQNANVEICGYADKGTGNAAVNKRLSEKRAYAVADALKEQGIADSRISIDFKGDKEQPFSANNDNRVCICIAAE